MAQLDPNIILQARGVQLDNPLDTQNKALTLQSLMQQQQIHNLQLQQQQRVYEQENTLSDLYKNAVNPDGSLNRNAVITGAAQQGLGNRIPGLQKQFADTDKAAADVNEILAKTDASKFGVVKQKLDITNKAISSLLANPNVSHDDVIQTITGLTQNGIISQDQGAQMVRQLPGDPAALRRFLVQKGLETDDAAKRMELLLPKAGTLDTGDRIMPTQTNQLTGEISVGQQPLAQKQVSPDTAANNATSRSNNAATIKKDLMVAGLNPDGTSNDNVEAMARLIAEGKAAPITGFALAKPAGQMIMKRVTELNPTYDEADWANKNKASKDFGSGTLGNAMRSFNVAGQHLDQLGELVDALDNGNMQLVNKAANLYSQQTGNPKVTNFDAAKDVVSKEVVKAIVAGGGGVSEREELARLMDAAKSPAQLKGVIQQYRNLMGAQYDALLQQRRAAGLSDATIPKYEGAKGKTTPAGAVDVQLPPDIQAILDKHGAK